MTTVPAPGASTPTPTADRALAPDLARGAMLLLIAVANVHVYLHGHGVGTRGYPVGGSTADRAVTWVQMTLVDGRAYPLFALLFGYGLVQLARRLLRTGAGPAEARRLLRRRGAWLIVFGLVHAALLFSGDILGAYGVLAVVLVGAVVSRTDRGLLVAAAWWLLPLGVLGLLQGVPVPSEADAFLPSMGTTDPLVATAFRLVEWVLLTVFMTLSVAAAVLGGAWASRRRLLDRPEQHLRLLRWGAVLGLPLAALGAQPMALMAAEVWSDPPVLASVAAGALHAVTGYAGGVGYACLAGLAAVAVADRRGPAVRALSACGRRSLTCYLAQSVVFVALLASYGGGLGSELGVAGATVIATVTWAGTVVLAAVMDRRGWAGPFEVLLRRLVYRRNPG